MLPILAVTEPSPGPSLPEGAIDPLLVTLLLALPIAGFALTALIGRRL